MPEDNSNSLNFDRAEYEAHTPHAATCNLCQSPLKASYYEINGQIACPTCKDNVEIMSHRGSGLGRFLKSLGLGIPAAALGSGIYYAIAALTGYEFGLVAVVIGLLVGGAVRVGSNRRGGWAYQGLAILLTYLSIASTYLPYAFQAFEEPMVVDSNSIVLEESGKVDSAPVDVEEVSESAYAEVIEEEEPLTAGSIALGVVFLTGLALALPFLGGFENVIGLLIIGFALYEAWKLNRRVTIHIAGPFDLKRRPSP